MQRSLLLAFLAVHCLGHTIIAETRVATPAGTGVVRPEILAAFKAFPKVKIHQDGEWLWVESNGLPDHPMMIGITSWQQQVALPQAYTGSNGWQIPAQPKVAPSPIPLHNRFLRGAVALAANGIPIFNPQNNRGEVSQDIGELDKWGGHCGRGDDYHYHIIPLHLQTTVGKGLPVACALDGYPVYGTTEPDGSTLRKLDDCGGHEDAKYGYHYHGTGKTPYVFAAFHGVVTEAEGQVDPQPRAQPVREATSPLRGAVITGFTADGDNAWKLTYTVGGETRSIRYAVSGSSIKFDFDNGKSGKTTETYQRKEGGGKQGGGAGAKDSRPPRRER